MAELPPEHDFPSYPAAWRTEWVGAPPHPPVYSAQAGPPGRGVLCSCKMVNQAPPTWFAPSWFARRRARGAGASPSSGSGALEVLAGLRSTPLKHGGFLFTHPATGLVFRLTSAPFDGADLITYDPNSLGCAHEVHTHAHTHPAPPFRQQVRALSLLPQNCCQHHL